MRERNNRTSGCEPRFADKNQEELRKILNTQVTRNGNANLIAISNKSGQGQPPATASQMQMNARSDLAGYEQKSNHFDRNIDVASEIAP